MVLLFWWEVTEFWSQWHRRCITRRVQARKKEKKEKMTPTCIILKRFILLCPILLSSYQLSPSYCIFCMPIGFLCKHFVLHHSPSEVLPVTTVWRKITWGAMKKEKNRLEVKRLPLVPINHDYHEPSCQLKYQVKYQPHPSWRVIMLLTIFMPSSVDHV